MTTCRSRRAIVALAFAAASVSVLPLSFATTYTYTGSNGVYNNAGNWTPGGVPLNPGDDAIIGAGAVTDVTVGLDTTVSATSVTVDSGSILQLTNGSVLNGSTLVTTGTGQFEVTSSTTLANITNTGLINADNGTNTYLVGNITNSGTISFNSSSSYTGVYITGTVTLTGNGTVNFSGYDRTLANGANATLINAGNTIQGNSAAGLGYDSVALVNMANGTIKASTAGQTFVVDEIASTDMINQGLMQAVNGGTLQLTGNGGGAYNNTGGTITAAANSTVSITTSASVYGGTISTTGNGTVSVSGGSSFSNLTLAANFGLVNGQTAYFSGTINNTGTISVNSTGSYTDLFFVGNVTLTGGGTIQLSQAARVRGTGTTPTLINVNNQIVGETSSGSLGNDELTIVNQSAGTINANVLGSTLLIDPVNTTDMINQGLMEATNGGILQLNGNDGGAFNNTGGTITAGANSTVQFVNTASVYGGTLSGAGTFTTSYATLANLTNNANIIVSNGSPLTLVGAINNTGSITVNSTGTYTDLFMANVTLTGGGTINLANAARVRPAVANATLTNVNNLIQGETSIGSLGNGELILVNQASGVINANVAGLSLVIDENAYFPMINQGTLKATNGGILVLTSAGADGTYNNANGTITAADNSTVQFKNGATIFGGTVSTSGNGTIQIISGGASLSNLTLAATINQSNAVPFTLAGNITNTGSINVNSTGSYTDLFVTGTTTLTGSGTINLTQADRVRGSNNTLVNVNNFIQGDTNLGSLGNNEVILVNQGAGVINANNPGLTLVVDENPYTDMINQGFMEATNGGILQINGNGGGAYNNTGGTIRAGANSTVVLTNTASVYGGTLSSIGNGTFNVPDRATLANLTLNGALTTNNSSALSLAGSIGDYGSISIGSTGSFTDLFLVGNVTLLGSGTLNLANADRVRDGGNGSLVNYIRIQGETNNSGNFGNNEISITNRGTIDATVAGDRLLVDPAGSGFFLNDLGGVTEASNGGILELNGNGGGTFTNNGTFAANANSTLVMDNSATLTNNAGGVLTGGTYEVFANGTMTITGSAVTSLANTTTVILSGANSTLTFGGTAIESSLTQNSGTLEVLANRNYTAGPAIYTNDGTTQLGGGTFSVATFTNHSSGLLLGFGNVAATITNAGLVEAFGGTLAFTTGVTGTSGTLQSDANSTLDLSQGSQTSTTGTLTNNGSLTLGANNVTVAVSYTNAGFGTGNAFNKHANVSTSGGLILAAGNNTQSVTGSAVSNGTTTTPTLAFGNQHVTTSSTLSYQIANNGSGPSILFAIQPGANGGSITDGRLSGGGVTSANAGPVAAAASSSVLGVTFNVSSDGPLTNQKVHLANNFDNNTSGTLAEQTLTITGTGYNFAAPVLNSASVNLGNVHVSSTPISAAFSVKNNAPNDGFSEKLDALTGSPTGPILISGSIPQLAPQSTDSTSITASFTPTTAGAKNGVAQITFISDGTGTSGLGNTTISNTTLTATANVFRLAAPSSVTPNPVVFGNHHVGDVVAPIGVSVTNTAANDGFSEKLDGSLSNAVSSGISFSGSYSLIAPQASLATVLATLDTSSPGSKSGSANVSFVSNGNGTSGLGNTSLSGQQSLSATGAVYRLATPGAVSNVDLGTIHVGDSGVGHVSVSNTAATDGYSESLDATLSGPITGPVSASGNTVTVSPGGSNSTGLTLTLDTSSAGLSKSGSATLHYVSNGTGSSGLGLTAVSNGTVSITANVLNFAAAAFQKDSGSGTFASAGANAYTLNFGNITTGSSVSALLGVLNAATAPSDTLAGTFTIGSGGFTTSGFNSFAGIAAGTEDSGLSVSFSNSTLGSYSETITLVPRSQDVSYNGALANVTLTLNANVITAATPEPASLGLLGLGAAALLMRRKQQ